MPFLRTQMNLIIKQTVVVKSSFLITSSKCRVKHFISKSSKFIMGRICGAVLQINDFSKEIFNTYIKNGTSIKHENKAKHMRGYDGNDSPFFRLTYQELYLRLSFSMMEVPVTLLSLVPRSNIHLIISCMLVVSSSCNTRIYVLRASYAYFFLCLISPILITVQLHEPPIHSYVIKQFHDHTYTSSSGSIN